MTFYNRLIDTLCQITPPGRGTRPSARPPMSSPADVKGVTSGRESCQAFPADVTDTTCVHITVRCGVLSPSCGRDVGARLLSRQLVSSPADVTDTSCVDITEVTPVRLLPNKCGTHKTVMIRISSCKTVRIRIALGRRRTHAAKSTTFRTRNTSPRASASVFPCGRDRLLVLESQLPYKSSTYSLLLMIEALS